MSNKLITQKSLFEEVERLLELSDEIATRVPVELGSIARDLNSSLEEVYDRMKRGSGLSDNKVVQSYVYKDDKAWFVSTIERDYLDVYGPTRGEETLVWEMNPDTFERGEIVFQGSGVSDHINAIEQLRRNGEIE